MSQQRHLGTYKMATPNSSFGFNAGDDPACTSKYPLYEQEERHKMEPTNQKLCRMLINSLRQVCKDNIEFCSSVKITGNIIVNTDNNHIDVIELSETVDKQSSLERHPHQSGTGLVTTDGAAENKANIPESLPTEFQVRPRIDAEVQTDISLYEPSFYRERKPCIFLNAENSACNVAPHPTGYIIPHANPPPVEQSEKVGQLTGLQKLTGANRRKFKHVKKSPVQIVSEKELRAELEQLKSHSEESDVVEEGADDVGEEISTEEEWEEKPDKHDPDFSPDLDLSGEDEMVKVKRGKNPRRSSHSKYATQSTRINIIRKMVQNMPKISNAKPKKSKEESANKKPEKGDAKKQKRSQRKYCCPDCNFTFTAVSKLRAHQKAAHNTGGLECSDCGKRYSCRLTLRRHVNSVHRGEKYPCEICGRTFTSPNTLYHHKRGEHSEIKPFNCDQCQKAFKFHHSYKLHILKHKGLRPHKCLQCEKTYLTSNHLKQHVQVVHGLTRNYTCSTCGKKFGYLNSLKVHEKLHTAERPYKCTICNKGFINLGALKGHAGRHVVGRHFKCDECGKFYKTDFLLKIHKRRHTEAVSRFMCDICGLTFMFKSNLEMHAAVHSDVKKYQCSTCGKAFKTYPTLYSHQQCHNPNDLFKCGVCGKMFKTKGRCHAHEKRHTEQKKHPCHYCQKFFSSKGDLSKHKRTVHSDAKRFCCPICGKPSARSDNLRVHLTRVHGKDPKEVNVDIMRITEGTSGDDMGHQSGVSADSDPVLVPPVPPISLPEPGVASGVDPANLATMVPLPVHCNPMGPSTGNPIPPQQHMEAGGYQAYSMALHSTGMTAYWYQDT